MRHFFLRLVSCTTFVLAVLLTACQPKAISMTPEEQQRVEALTANMTTRCVGRYLVDMPERFVLNSESRTVIEGVTVAVKPMEKRLFEIALMDRHTNLQRETIIGEDTPSLLSATEIKGESGLVFNRSRSRESAVLRTLEIFSFRDGYAITAQINARDMAFAEPDPTDTRKTDTPEKLAHLLKVYGRVTGRKDTEVPTVPGLCIPNGFVAGAERKGQETDAVYHLNGAPDVWFGFGSSDAIKEKTTLFDRAPDVERSMKDGGSKTLRKQKPTLHDQTYEEWLFINTPEQDDVRGSYFLIHGNELRTDPAQPFIEFKLHNGNRIPVGQLSMEEKDRLGLFKPLTKATLSDAEALAIWDKVTATLRPRPGAF
jgi:hypothetical protein